MNAVYHAGRVEGLELVEGRRTGPGGGLDDDGVFRVDRADPAGGVAREGLPVPQAGGDDAFHRLVHEVVAPDGRLVRIPARQAVPDGQEMILVFLFLEDAADRRLVPAARRPGPGQEFRRLFTACRSEQTCSERSQEAMRSVSDTLSRPLPDTISVPAEPDSLGPLRF